ncbi:MAG: PAS domain S-box protein, partial [Nitrospira sp.]|nr:PAS domain S-box protein [Nitrospira sp.]
MTNKGDKMKKKVKCWEVFECKEKECPAYELKELKCWLTSGTHCRDEIQGKYLEKMAMCLGCEVFKANMDVSSMKDTVEVIDKQFKEFTAMVDERDKELEDISMELSLGLSETLEALNKIASGDPRVKIPEVSENELIAKLKQVVNKTAREIGTIVDQSHEFAIGLAEHFDVLHRVSKGEMDTRIPESSQDELLKALGRITNQMIESRKQAEDALREKVEREDLILCSLPMAFYTAKASGDFGWIWVSEQIDQFSGFPANKFVEDPNFWASRLHPDDRDRVLKVFETIHNKGTIATEYRWQYVDGSYLWFRDQAVLIRDKQGNPKEIIGTWRDITERKQAEKELQEANEKLTVWVKELEQRNREISMLGEMGGLLQTCLTAEEAYSIIVQFAQQLFPAESGALCVFSASRNIVEAVAVWGESLLGERAFAPEDCWALRRGHVHLVEDPKSGLHCRHLGHPPSVSYMCVPMMAQGETLGMLHLQ